MIALVITIIVMLILVAVTISMAVNGGLFEYAQRAGIQTNAAVANEQKFADLEANMTVDQLIDKYTGGSEGEDIVGVDGEIFSALYTKTKEYKDENDDIAVIPRGFSVGKSDGINTVDEGLVIQDKDGNQFVWIPVPVTGETQAEKEASFEALRKRYNEDESVGVEPYASGYTGGNGEEEGLDYSLMRASVIQNGGFYIGRFEAGTTTPRAGYLRDDETITEEQRTSEMVVKRDVYPYNFVGWGASIDDYISNVIHYSYPGYGSGTYLGTGKGAMYLSKQMYKGKDVGVTSILCYGIQWDALMDFIKDEKNISNSVTWGNYSENSLSITRTTAKYYENNQWHPITESGYSKTSGKLLTTGAHDSFVAKNIFDIAGNCMEWTNESFSGDRRYIRGGDYGSHYPAYYRYAYFSYITCSGSGISFRPVLYIS